jgi:formylglycine-generating enzyme required for sulfatase activity
MTTPAMRGGSWFSAPPVQLPQEPPLGLPLGCRAASRLSINPADVSTIVGFRVVCLPPEVKPTQVAIRGGSHAQLNYPWCRSTWCRSACRCVCHSPDYTYDDIGFRVICLPPS